MSIYALGLLFPIILGVHNAEEYFRRDDFLRGYPPRIARLLSRQAIRTAMVLLTMAAALISVLAWWLRTTWLLDVAVVADFALALNALGHVGRSIRWRSLAPGTGPRFFWCCRIRPSWWWCYVFPNACPGRP